MNHKKAIGFLLAASVLWSFAGVCIKSMSWNGFAITGIRGLIAAVSLLPAVRKPRLPRGACQIAAVLAYTGLICLTVISTKMTTAANAILLQYTSPIYSAILGYYILHERVTRRDIASIFMTFLGLVVFFYDGLTAGGGRLAGDLLALLSGVCFAAMNVFMRSDPEASPIQNVFWGNLLAFFLLTPFWGTLEWTRVNLLLIVFLGVFQLGLSYRLYSIAIRHVSAFEASITTVLEPVLNPIWVILAGREPLRPATVIGGSIVLLAVVMRNLHSRGGINQKVSS